MEMVLIETLWNVKKYYAGIGADGRIVLIETLWNVKLEDKLINDEMHVGINRNIVECKELLFYSANNQSQVLIETLWNVKFSDPELQILWQKY